MGGGKIKAVYNLYFFDNTLYRSNIPSATVGVNNRQVSNLFQYVYKTRSDSEQVSPNSFRFKSTQLTITTPNNDIDFTKCIFIFSSRGDASPVYIADVSEKSLVIEAINGTPFQLQIQQTTSKIERGNTHIIAKVNGTVGATTAQALVSTDQLTNFDYNSMTLSSPTFNLSHIIGFDYRHDNTDSQQQVFCFPNAVNNTINVQMTKTTWGYNIFGTLCFETLD